jgi:hypothetical protein
MFGFTIVWLGQIVSVLASLMTQFALSLTTTSCKKWEQSRRIKRET